MNRWDLLWYRLKGYAETRCLDSEAEAAVREDSPDGAYYRAMTEAYGDILRYMSETQANSGG